MGRDSPPMRYHGVMRAAVVLLTAMAGCNAIYGIEQTQLLPDADTRPDIDHDMIPDEVDPCIAGPIDRADDTDNDMVTADQDPCPMGDMAGKADRDGDGLYDDCDPHPASAGDRWRCTTRFLDEDVTVALWDARAGEHTFASGGGRLIGFPDPDVGTMPSMVSFRPLIADTGTSVIAVRTSPFNVPYTFRLWASAGDSPSSADVACELIASDAGVAIRTLGTTVLATSPLGTGPSKSADFVVVAELSPGATGMNLVCIVGYRNASLMEEQVMAQGHFDGTLGRQGFAVVDGLALVSMLFMYDRD